jgi:hypothetical protein
MVLILLLAGTTIAGWSQSRNLRYDIHRQGEKVGELTLLQTTDNRKVTYNIESLVKVKMIMAFTIQSWEQSVYENELLQASSLRREVNGKQKASKTIRSSGSSLIVRNAGKEKELKNHQVKYSTHCLYTMEPKGLGRVFSDSYQQYIPILKLANQHYKVDFPDGASNEYFYENGICKRVMVKSTLFNAEFHLVQH